MRTEPYVYRLLVLTTSGSNVKISFPPIPQGARLRLRWIAFDNECGGTCVFKAGITDLVAFQQTFINQSITNNNGYGIITDQWINPPELLTVNLFASANTGTVYLTASGDLYFPESDVTAPPPAAPAP